MEVRPGYKQTDVGVIPEDWETAKFAAVCSMKSGEGITSASIDQFSEYPCYGGNGLRGFTSRFTHDGRYALIGRQGALCGNVLGVDGKFYASEHAIVVTASARADIYWLTFVLGEMRLNQYSESSAQPGLSVSKLLSLDVACPPTKSEQEAIAEALSEADALIESLEQLLSKKRQLKQGAMQELLSGKKRLPGLEVKPGYKQTEVGVIPEDWDVEPLGSLCEIIAGRDLVKADYSPTGNQTYPFPIYSNALTNKGLYGYSKFYQYEADKITVTARGDIGHAVHRNTKFCAIGRLLVLSSKRACDLRFVAEFINNAVDFALESTGVPQLTAPQISKYAIALPPIKAEQEAIATILSDMDAEIAALEAKLVKARQLKQGMMQELLTGRIRLV